MPDWLRRLVSLRPALLVVAFAAALVLLPSSQAFAQGGDPASLVQAFGGKKSFEDTEATIRALAATGDPAVAPALQALADGNLYYEKDGGRVVIGEGRGASLAARDPLTGEALGERPKAALEKVRVKNSIRTLVAEAMGALTLGSADPAARLASATALFERASPDQIDMLDAAIAREDDPRVDAALAEARAGAVLKSDRPAPERVAAVATLEARGDRAALNMLRSAAGDADPTVAAAAQKGAAAVEGTIALWGHAQTVWYGLSLGSVLLLAAIGLAITFGVMGVINMAHGEMVMLGAYTTFVVQQAMRDHAPEWLDWSLAVALPLAFLVSGLVGLVMERGIIRFLYGRPLETLLATFGVSLILQQAIRMIFGPTNREVSNPSWMSGSFDIGQMAVTWNRLWIIVFALAVFAALLFVLNRTSAGLKMRAVTQNRRMAAAMGIRTPMVDALTFALGSGIAGMAGVALSQVDNVSPDLGQGYIIDSFMVVVFGGVGNLWGTLVGAFSLGIVNKLLEPYAGAVLGKIVVLVLIILFIQKRPRGLFALKGRFVDA
ncbi:urea ABC transporter permease subunit UrtB [Aureimonas phyllosphaerae]|uniref:Urea transport system permease protein n=1 Tax=Aureimonas phyllosphaerae TaxID=1166078 RepID=A0A7W6BTY1_9HYPH|nr:urea ABC transporter permease subunit UrtB [Aureimonas phyllosphaerae]MBB3936260.1 urea transport system permease protein [Aureimonas phyllosphaerae]MBB3960015.1 urea transport system permease protein [Aureimonas phyllosphaerae]SFF47450.1 amino acid/amide ABC transporter membrane protein 1, HAAT family [Aureimonas phyllosphaerae]